ncbi:type II toxin-antitoxin system Phd/YefM family antitoxin [Candidatus Peregrinibacteria bacterium]|nr:type II toxin-antitoxin system Phd/YefM family antitoxin [Candidatus Peregrinibacteria bacterium]
MQLTASSLRQNIYKVLDKSLETGQTVEIVRKGKVLRIVPPEKPDKLKNLPKRNTMKCDPEKLVHIDWSSEWKI